MHILTKTQDLQRVAKVCLQNLLTVAVLDRDLHAEGILLDQETVTGIGRETR